MIFKDGTLHGHRIKLYENMVNGGVDTILLTCYSCNQTWEFDRVEFPKYRLALSEAWKRLEEHLDKPVEPARVELTTTATHHQLIGEDNK